MIEKCNWSLQKVFQRGRLNPGIKDISPLDLKTNQEDFELRNEHFKATVLLKDVTIIDKKFHFLKGL